MGMESQGSEGKKGMKGKGRDPRRGEHSFPLGFLWQWLLKALLRKRSFLTPSRKSQCGQKIYMISAGSEGQVA